MWTLPGLGGVVAGVALSKWQRRPRRSAKDGGRLSVDLGPLLILVGCVYLYLTFLLLEFVRARELVELEETTAQPSRLLLIGFVGLSSLLLGLSAILILKLKVPGWLARSWEWLLQER